jgi:hypothetical protein
VRCLQQVDKPVASDFLTIGRALRYTTWFEEVQAVDYPMRCVASQCARACASGRRVYLCRDEGVAHMACAFDSLPQLRKCVLVNVKAGKAGIEKLAEAIAQGNHGVQFLNVSKNNIGDAGVKTLLDALLKSDRVLETLSIQGCGFSAKGFRCLVDAIRQPSWLKGLRVLDVSDNAAGKLGTAALCEWIALTDSLHQVSRIPPMQAC